MKHVFPAMGTQVVLIADPGSDPITFNGAVDRVERIFDREEKRFSRFRADSELCRVNRSSGRVIRVSTSFAVVVHLALEGAAGTDGLFDPTVLGALVAAGYDRDFDEVIAGARAALHSPVPCGRWREVTLEGGQLRVPRGVGLDLGGLAKGWTADRAAEGAVAAGLSWAIVNAGGDLRVAGHAPVMEIGVEEPERPDETCASLLVDGGALATSSVTHRRWGPGRHHLVDPRTGLPAHTNVLQATVWAKTCAAAEIASKQALLEGSAALRPRLPALLVLSSGEIVTNIASAERAA